MSGRVVQAGEMAWADHPKYAGVRMKLLIGRDTSPTFSTHLVQIAPGAAIGAHDHQDEAEAMYCIAGAGVGQMEGEETLIAPGVTIFAPAGVPHELRNPGAETLEMLCIFSPPRG